MIDPKMQTHAACLLDKHDRCPEELQPVYGDPDSAWDPVNRSWTGRACLCQCHKAEGERT